MRNILRNNQRKHEGNKSEAKGDYLNYEKRLIENIIINFAVQNKRVVK